MQPPAIMLSKFQNLHLGLLIVRVGVGAVFILHGLPKLAGGPETWESIGKMGMPFLEDGFLPTAMGFLAGLTEAGGGLLLVLGLFFPYACLALVGVMAVAFSTKLGEFSGIMDFAYKAGWPLELLIVFAALFFTGPGKIALGGKSAAAE